jgi:toxin FitB
MSSAPPRSPVAEIRYGIERLPAGHRKDDLLSVAADLFAAFGDLVRPFDAAAAAWYGQITARRGGLGLPIGSFAAQIAAICRTQDAALATRNIKDFAETGVGLINPWQETA